MGVAFHMYASANKQFLPYPTTKLIDPDPNGEAFLWFIAIDPYLAANTKEQANRTGVARFRTYKAFKQCPVYETFEGEKESGAQSNTKEFARTFKMNDHLRRNNPKWYCKITDVKRSAEFVMMGDGLSLDQTGPVPGQSESGRFSMEVNDPSDASPALRHKGGANILFVDGHASHVYLKKTITKTLSAPTVKVKSWESEYVNAAGIPSNLTNPRQTAAQQGLRRNPNMPLFWSDPPKLYRP